MGNILYLRRMGWDFTPGINHDSDVGNFRVRTEGENIRGKNGKMYFLEFTLWRDRKQARYTHKITGKALKHTHYDIINKEALHLDTEFTHDGYSYSDLTLEKAIHEHNYSYTLENILKVVNEISADYYDEIIFID